MSDTYFEANRLNWNERAVVHADSKTYDLQAFITDPKHLSDVVIFDQRYLGDLTDQQAVHLQCHIGTDTLSLARLGATVTGLDQSEASLDAAQALFNSANTEGQFVLSNVYDAVDELNQQYDLVYTGVGALNWLPDVQRWARVVARLLKPGGRLYLREGHPMLWSLDDSADITDGSLRVRYPYFETREPMVFDDAVTYTGPEAVIKNTRMYEWNHGLGEIVTAVMAAGLTLETLDEHDGLEWQMFPHMVLEDRQYKLPAEQRALVPMMYTLVAQKPEAPDR